jgi:IS30 family transposase
MNISYTKKHFYKHLSFEERVRIQTYLSLGWSISKIAINLRRAKSAISNEIARSKTRKFGYKAHLAQKYTNQRLSIPRKPLKSNNPDLMRYIEHCLKRRWSPEIIANTWTGEPINHTTIYTMTKTIRREWHRYLAYQHKCRYRKGLIKSVIPNRIDISDRPPVKEFGDFEADTVISSREGKSCIGVFAERTTRLYKVVKMRNKTADEMVNAAWLALSGLPVKTITYDNGTENMKHEKINRIFGCKSYFCRPYCSGDKGLVENRNKMLRLWLPKKTNFDLISENELSRIETEINERPMKCLNWLSPIQAFQIANSFCLYL